MAITIVDSPNNFALLHQKLIYLCTSGNVANTGFRFQFEITINSETLTFLVPPNPNNKGVMDIREVIRGYFYPLLAPADPDNISIHELGASDSALHEYEDAATSTWIRTVVVVVKEGWIIAGVFTPTAVGQATDTIVVYASKFDRLAGKFPGYKPSPDYISEQFLTDRIAGVTNLKGFPSSNGFGFNDVFVKIGVRSGSDKGIVSFIVDNGTLLPSDTGTAELRLTIYDSVGAPHAADYTITTSATGRIAHFGGYPYNLNSTDYVIIKPSDYPGFRCYTLELVDGANAVYGQKLLFYPMPEYDSGDCLLGTEGIKLGWINSMGGWDYFWFTKLFTEKYEVERKRFRKVLGTYGAATFDFAEYDRGLTELDNATEELITMSTDWLEDGEFQFLGNLIRSNHVYIVNNVAGIANIAPVLIEQNDWADQKSSFTQMKKLELTVRLANQLW